MGELPRRPCPVFAMPPGALALALAEWTRGQIGGKIEPGGEKKNRWRERTMKLGISRLSAVFALSAIAFINSALAKTVKQEPPMGQMREGELLVDDGSCPGGQIKKVIGGNHVKVGGNKQIERVRRCIKR